MKKALFIVSIILLAAACGKVDKKAQLAKLISERDKLNGQITAIEKEIAGSGKDSIAEIPVDVSVTEIQSAEFNHYVEVQGRVDGEENVTVTSKMAGVISKIFVKEGDNVKAGQVLAEMDAQVLRQQLEELKLQLSFATNIYNKQKNLWDQNIGSEIQFLTAKTNKESYEKRIATTQEQLEMSVIKSPIKGSVEEVLVKIGQGLQPGITAFRVVNFSRIKIIADVAEAYSPKVQPGDEVIIYFPDLNQEITTTLNFTSKYINPVNRTFTVEARVDNSKYNFRANMIAVVKINDYKAKSAYSLPVNVIQDSMEGHYIYLVISENGRFIARKKMITLGLSYNGMCEIASGLNAGDKVVTSGYQSLKEGQVINYSIIQNN
jgi:RND family efflux transporter MFP subunit